MLTLQSTDFRAFVSTDDLAQIAGGQLRFETTSIRIRLIVGIWRQIAYAVPKATVRIPLSVGSECSEARSMEDCNFGVWPERKISDYSLDTIARLVDRWTLEERPSDLERARGNDGSLLAQKAGGMNRTQIPYRFYMTYIV